MDPIALRIACGVVLAAALLMLVWRFYKDDLNDIADDAQWIQWHEHIERTREDGRG